ncbi:MAG: outer membrane lipoprotein-sorting protein [Nitrospinae bacterium RIFCSPLOWO2_12_FULL_47_7]|nr:MAG: outer membrane lipoprotein-sorting protein [Nitrospinae bacterium RIFCSPLOWO2_12_FULL_47_7]
MKKKRFKAILLFVGFYFVSISSSMAVEIDAIELLKAIDRNMWSDTKFIEGRLIIDNGRRERTLGFEAWLEGIEKSYSHYNSPPRESGTKMLKIRDKLWMYTPETDRKVLIAGHLLRQSMMGSDLSYEDMMEDRKLSQSYVARMERFEDIDGLNSAVLLLQANEESVTYQTRRLWTDPGKKIVLREERYAKSGKLLKKVEYFEYIPIKSRLFPKRLVFRDMLKEDTHTTYVFDVIQFDVEIPEKYFNVSILRR